MVGYRFKVIFEDFDEVVRYVEIKASQSFTDLHNIIQESVGFDGSKDCYFYFSTSNWRKTKEIATSDAAHIQKQEGLRSVHNTPLNTFVDDPHQKFIYVFDPEVEWVFLVEMVKIFKIESIEDYPRCVKKEGVAPPQYADKGRFVSRLDEIFEEPLLQVSDEPDSPGVDDDDEGDGGLDSEIGEEYSEGEFGFEN